MQSIRNNSVIFIGSVIFLLLNLWLVMQDNYYGLLVPFGLFVAYAAIYYLKWTFLAIAFLTPVSVNLEEFTEGRIGLFVPTEPILFGLLLLLILFQIYKPFIPRYAWRHPITIALGCYLFWLIITSITSVLPIVSFKFVLMKTWYIAPMLLIGIKVFEHPKNIIRFLWLFSIAMVIIMVFTVIRHSGYNFGEKEGHWVMEPFFKDHTIYGAAVAINLFFLIGLYAYKKHSLLLNLFILILLLVNLVALYFSYTRGAWLSVIFAAGVWLLIKYKIKFKYLLFIAAVIGGIILLSWTEIEYQLSKNEYEHTTEDFGERMQSAANVTSDASNLERLNRWDAAWHMFLDRPFFGFGPATYAFEYAAYQDPQKLTIISTNFGDGGNAHSEYLGPLAETGVIGLLTVLVFVGLLFYTGIQLYIQYPAHLDGMKIIILCLVLAMATYFFHGILNNYLDTDKAAVPVYGTCAMLIALQNRLKHGKF